MSLLGGKAVPMGRGDEFLRLWHSGMFARAHARTHGHIHARTRTHTHHALSLSLTHTHIHMQAQVLVLFCAGVCSMRSHVHV